nr:hypothetical protein [Tanacetum cinerariifolium]
MDIFSFIHNSDPTKVRVVERERNVDEPRLLDTTIGRIVSLLPVAPDHADSELEASPVVEAANTVVEDAAPVQSRHQGKRKFMVVDACGVSHPPKKLREDHETPSGASVGGKSRSVLWRLLVRAVLNAKVGVAAIPTLPFVTAYVSTTSEREVGDHTKSVAEPNLCTIWAPRRSFVPIMTIVTTTTSTVDPTLVTKGNFVETSPFGADSSSAGGTDPITSVFSDLTGSDFLVGAIRTVINPDTDLQKEKIRLKSVVVESQGELLKAREEEIESLKAWLLLREMEVAESIRLRAKASNFETVEQSLRDDTNALRERNVILEKERNALDVKVTKLETSVMSKECELTYLNALVTSVKYQNDSLADPVHELEISSFELQEKVTVYENCMEQLEKFQDDQMKIVEDKFDNLYTDFVEMTLHLKEKFYPHLLTTISGRRWILTYGMKLAVANCLNSPEYLSALGAAIGKAIEKGMQDGLSTRITHGKEGMVLSDVAAYNPSAEVDYIFALQHLQNVNFFLLARLKSSKDASVETVMDILRFDGPLAKKLGLNELQPNVDHLMVPIHHSPDQVVVGATALMPLMFLVPAFGRLGRILQIKDLLFTMCLSLWLSLFSAVLIGTKGNSDTTAVTTGATMVLSTTFSSASTIAPIYVEDYEVMGADDQAVADEDVASFPSVDDAELNIPQ